MDNRFDTEYQSQTPEVTTGKMCGTKSGYRDSNKSIESRAGWGFGDGVSRPFPSATGSGGAL